MSDQIEARIKALGTEGSVSAPARHMTTLIMLAGVAALVVIAMMLYSHEASSSRQDMAIANLNIQLLASNDKMVAAIREQTVAIREQTVAAKVRVCVDSVPASKRYEMLSDVRHYCNFMVTDR